MTDRQSPIASSRLPAAELVAPAAPSRCSPPPSSSPPRRLPRPRSRRRPASRRSNRWRRASTSPGRWPTTRRSPRPGWASRSYVLGDNTLPPRDRELLILRIGYLRGSEYEWGQHTRIARSVGVTDDEILRVIDGPDAAGWSTFDSALLRAVDELHHDSEVSDATWAELSGRYDTRQLMDLVFTVGQYNLVSIALRTFRVPLDEGVEGFPR